MNNCQIVILLFSLISSPSSTVELRINACDCLVEIFSRKGEIRTTAEYRKMFLQFVSKDVLQWIHQVTMYVCVCVFVYMQGVETASHAGHCLINLVNVW